MQKEHRNNRKYKTHNKWSSLESCLTINTCHTMHQFTNNELHYFSYILHNTKRFQIHKRGKIIHYLNRKCSTHYSHYMYVTSKAHSLPIISLLHILTGINDIYQSHFKNSSEPYNFARAHNIFVSVYLSNTSNTFVLVF